MSEGYSVSQRTAEDEGLGELMRFTLERTLTLWPCEEPANGRDSPGD